MFDYKHNLGLEFRYMTAEVWLQARWKMSVVAMQLQM